MSFDLYIYKQRDNQFTEVQLADYLTNNLPYNVSDHSRQWDYENPETGVYFMIDWNEPDTDSERIKVFDSFSDFEYLNFSISVNFFRPSFFGLEIFPIIDELIEDLGLLILNPQDELDPNNPRVFPRGYLQDQWMRHNDKLTVDHFEELNFEYFPLEKSNYMWWFQLHREQLQSSLTEDVFVPGFFLLKSKEDGILYTACVWPEHIPIILPPVDYLIVKKKYKNWFKTVEESGLVTYEIIMNQFGEQFEGFPSEIPELKILRQANADRIGKQFNSMTLGRTLNEFGSGVAFDSFVNVRP